LPCLAVPTRSLASHFPPPRVTVVDHRLPQRSRDPPSPR
jgi:hypothetical protein